MNEDNFFKSNGELDLVKPLLNKFLSNKADIEVV
jgi:hypothetical protein